MAEITIKRIKKAEFLFQHRTPTGKKAPGGYDIVHEHEFDCDVEEVIMNLITKLNISPDVVIKAAEEMKIRRCI